MAHARLRHLSAAVVVTALVSSTLAAAPVAADVAEPPGDCLPPIATGDLEVGTVATGWTVSKGRTPVPFDAEILGVLPDEIAPGRDLIIIEASSPAIDAAGGIWAGMSGSPVVIEQDGETHLVGALAYGFSLGPNKIAGLTPASDLVTLAQRGGSAGDLVAPESIELDAQTRRSIAEEAGIPMRQVGPSLSRLPLPLSVRAHPLRASRLTAELRDNLGPDLVPFAGGGRSRAAGTSTSTPAPGDNFAGVLVSGDLTFAGVGTTSYVCDGSAVAFGHPFLGTGPTTMGANAADAVTVIADPTLTPYKMATIAESVGTIDQDRLAGIRARLGQAPPSVPVTSRVTELDDGGSRDGASAVHHGPSLADAALFHALYNVDTVFDRVGGGSSLVTTTVQGTRDGGAPWSLEIANRHVSRGDIAFDSLFDLYFDVYELDGNDAEAVQITGVHADVDVEVTERTYQVRRVLVRDASGAYMPADEVGLRAGQEEQLRVALRRVDRRDGKLVSTPDEVEFDVTLAIPADAMGPAVLQVTAGPGAYDEDPYECFFDDCPTSDLTFDELLDAIAARPRNDDLVVRLFPADSDEWEEEYVERFDDDVTSDPIAMTTERLDRVGTGAVAVEVEIAPLPTSKPALVRGNSWRLREHLSAGPSDLRFSFGRTGDVRLMCDWTGNGPSPVVFRDGTWYVTSEPGGAVTRTFTYGKKGDTPICGDWNGNGKDSPGVVRGKTWLLRNSMKAGKPAHEFTFGAKTDVKVVGDWDGDGIDTPGLRRGTEWRLRNGLTSGSSSIRFEFGHAKGVPVIGDWDGDGRDSVGVVRDGAWRLRNDLTAGPADVRFDFGRKGDVFLTW